MLCRYSLWIERALELWTESMVSWTVARRGSANEGIFRAVEEGCDRKEATIRNICALVHDSSRIDPTMRRSDRVWVGGVRTVGLVMR